MCYVQNATLSIQPELGNCNSCFCLRLLDCDWAAIEDYLESWLGEKECSDSHLCHREHIVPVLQLYQLLIVFPGVRQGLGCTSFSLVLLGGHEGGRTKLVEMKWLGQGYCGTLQLFPAALLPQLLAIVALEEEMSCSCLGPPLAHSCQTRRKTLVEAEQGRGQTRGICHQFSASSNLPFLMAASISLMAAWTHSGKTEKL